MSEEFKEYYKGIEYRITKLEKDISKVNYAKNQMIEINQERIEEMEKKIDDHIEWSINEERIEKLEKLGKEHTQILNLHKSKIAELKILFEHQCENCQILMVDRVKEIETLTWLKEQFKKWEILYFDRKAKYGYHQFYNRTHAGLRDLKEVLREHIEAHKFIADQGTEIIIMDKWIEHLDKTLAKLDGDKSDSEASTETDVGGKSEESQPSSKVIASKVYLEVVTDILKNDKEKPSEQDKKIMREMIPKADEIIYDDPKEVAEPRQTEHMWSHLTDVSYCDICNQFAHRIGYDSECVIEEERPPDATGIVVEKEDLERWSKIIIRFLKRCQPSLRSLDAFKIVKELKKYLPEDNNDN